MQRNLGLIPIDLSGAAPGQTAHDPATLAHLARLYDPALRAQAFRGGNHAAWAAAARPILRRLIGLERMDERLVRHEPVVRLEAGEALDGCTRAHGILSSEPEVAVPFWFLRPVGPGPFPLLLVPHGHAWHGGYDTVAGIARDAGAAQHMAAQQRDLALQAAQRGFAAIAPATRGFFPACIPDLDGRHERRSCRSQLMHALYAGRTAIAERVWDLMRLIDWAMARSDIDARRIAMTGNSGGGVATIYAAACDERIALASPSCSFRPVVGLDGCLKVCDCNLVPDLLSFGELYDVAGLIAPRPLLILHGREDTGQPCEEVERGLAGLRPIYAAAGATDRLEHRWCEGGHRPYPDVLWPFLARHLGG